MSQSNSAKVGAIGEDIASRYLENRGFTVIERNFRRKYGEIDVICERGGILHFVEVKSVSRKTHYDDNVAEDLRPEENMHRNKVMRLRRVVEVYLSLHPSYQEFKFHLITVKLNHDKLIAKVQIFEDVII